MSAVPTDSVLDAMRASADPLADEAIACVLGPWSEFDAVGLPSALAARSEQIAWVNRQFAGWRDNASLENWRALEGTPPELAACLERFVAEARVLPSWAEPAKIARAEQLFFDYSLLSCTLLFCASLPECYVVPDLAAVLHVAGQLERHTDHRVRTTGAMVFPVMMHGGLSAPEGCGIAQVLKVRLIHATIRNYVLRGNPAQARSQPALNLAAPTGSMHEALLALGWDVAEEGMPCNQEELAYTLLTFSYVFLRGMRTLGLGLSRADEEACLHGWNVMGHVLGIRRELMADSMDEAAELFARIQARGRARPVVPDSRPALAGALIAALRATIPLPFFRTFPLLFTRYLCGRKTSRDLGLSGRVSIVADLLFGLLLGLARVIDTVVRWFSPEFAISRLITRLIGYPLVTRLLLDQTRPLVLPERLLAPVGGLRSRWKHDPKAGRWINALESRVSGRGS